MSVELISAIARKDSSFELVGMLTWAQLVPFQCRTSGAKLPLTIAWTAPTAQTSLDASPPIPKRSLLMPKACDIETFDHAVPFQWLNRGWFWRLGFAEW